MKDIIRKLHPLEIKVIPFLKNNTEVTQITKKSGLQEIQVIRALQWLSNKNMLKIIDHEQDMLVLGKNGLFYKKNGLPEKRFLNSIKQSSLPVSQILKKAQLQPEELNICIGTLRKKAAIEIKKDKLLNNNEKGLGKSTTSQKEMIISITDAGKSILSKESLEEKFLNKDFPLSASNLKPEDKFAYNSLKSRKEILSLTKVKTKSIQLTQNGKKLVSLDISLSDTIDTLTPKVIKSGEWKKKQFREYDVSINVPRIYGGKKHFINQASDYIKKIWLDLGFQEMEGNFVQTSFWDLDSLFVPQDHPARQMQDTFYIKDPKHGKLPPIYKKIKEVHENGGDTGSKGWQTKWSEDIAKENLLRTHTTVLSAQTLSKLKKEDLPAKFFSVNKVFRNETLDYKHLFEFYQVEGIVVDPNADFTNLKGYLREFFTKMGFKDVRIRPGHFPYTEPSAEVDVLHPTRNEWIELGGSGIFRPELTKPLLGFECPVLAWGLGLGRTVMDYWDIKDLREFYKNDLKQTREMKTFTK